MRGSGWGGFNRIGPSPRAMNWRRQIGLMAVLVLLALCPAALRAQTFSPAQLGGLVLWVDAQDITGTGAQPASGASVTQWAHKSGRGNHMTRAAGTVSYQPTGIDARFPALRFPIGARMTAPNPFPAAMHNQMTVFFVLSNVSPTSNAAVSLNGNVLEGPAEDHRFLFHAPWGGTNNVIFDIPVYTQNGRLIAPLGKALTTTTLFMGLNDQPGNRQWLRIDGRATASDNTGSNAGVARGVHIGDQDNNFNFDGRFAELVIYDRALSLAEVQEVECYLLRKWTPEATSCGMRLEIQVASAPDAAGGTGAYRLPQGEVRYTITATRQGQGALTSDSLFLVSSVPGEVSFYNGDFDEGGAGSGPFGFAQSGTALQFDPASDARYSSSTVRPTTAAQCSLPRNRATIRRSASSASRPGVRSPMATVRQASRSATAPASTDPDPAQIRNHCRG